MNALAKKATEKPIDDLDRRIVAATQAGLPLCARPYHAVAQSLGIEPGEVMRRMESLLARGVIRRIGAVPNHYALGYQANGMSVWNIPDQQVSELGRRVGALEFVTHCYRRPRCLPDWPYNLFAMVHGQSRSEVELKVAQIAALLGEAGLEHDVIYSTRVLKKTGLRIAP